MNKRRKPIFSLPPKNPIHKSYIIVSFKKPNPLTPKFPAVTPQCVGHNKRLLFVQPTEDFSAVT